MKLQKLFALAACAVASVTAATAQLNVTLRGHLSYGSQTCANICGYVDSLGNEYALVGASVGLSVVDVTDPSAPTQVYQHVGPANAQSEWQEIKVRGKYAYVTTEAGGGLQIFDLSSLPDASGITMHSYTGDGAIAGQLNTIHSLHIDGHYVYIYGSNLFAGGAVVADISDPWNPVYAGKYSIGAGNQAYVHDGYVRNDTLYACHIYSGYFSVVDFTNKAAPVELANQYTPSNFTHNSWLSTNSKVLFTTDEVNNSYLTSYDISDLGNITLLDKIQSNPGSQSIVHNTHILNVAGNDYAVTSWYRDGFTIVDAGRPDNLVQVGNYDTYPSGSGGGFNGDWGVYPFLPSGTIVVSNIEDGLYVFTPNYVRACYLEGAVTDSVCGVTLSNVHVSVAAVSINDSTDGSGVFRTGTAVPGTYSVTFTKSGYYPKTLTGIVLSPGVVNNLNVELVPFNTISVNGTTTDNATSAAVGSTSVMISDATNSYNFVTDAGGAFNSCNIVAASDYNIIAGKWGYNGICLSGQDISASNNVLSLPMDKGYYDDFSLNLGWTVSSTATTGMWVRGVPIETLNGSVVSNPGSDDSTDCSNIAYVTGNGGGAASTDDVDNGATTLLSPVFDLTAYTNPYVNFSRWFYDAAGTGTPNDSLTISLSNGLSIVPIDIAVYNTAGNSSWLQKSLKVSDFIAPTATMKLIVRTEDNNPGHLVEAGFDKFSVTEGPLGIAENALNAATVSASPNPFTTETTISYAVSSRLDANASLVVTDITGRVVEARALSQAKGTVLLNRSINSGIYFVTLINGNDARIPVKIVKTN